MAENATTQAECSYFFHENRFAHLYSIYHIIEGEMDTH